MTDKEKLNALLDIVISIMTSLRLVFALNDNPFVAQALNKILDETVLKLKELN